MTDGRRDAAAGFGCSGVFHFLLSWRSTSTRFCGNPALPDLLIQAGCSCSFLEHVFSCSELRPRTLLGGGKDPGPGSRAAGSLPDWLGFEELSNPFEMFWDVPSNTGTLWWHYQAFLY